LPETSTLKLGQIQIVITGLPTHSVGGQTSNGRWRLSSSVTFAYAT